jgi:diguanylate cyclase (GGDEF)-like protein
VVVVPVILIALYAAGTLTLEAIVWFATTFLVVLGLAFGRQAYLLLDNRRSVLLERELREEVMRRNEELEALTGLATTMTQTLEEAPILERGLGVLHLAARATSSAFFLRTNTGHQLSATTGFWPTEHAWAGKPEAPAGGRALHTRGGREILRLSLTTRGNDIGYVTLMRDAADAYTQQELDLLGLLGDQLAIAVQNARDYREKLEQAIRDPLTGLYNRRFFYEALEKEVQRSARYGTTASLVLFDIDNFKSINDTLGHGAGDDVLRKIGQIVGRLIRPTDSFARLGGEEFGLLLPETGQLDALLAAERLRTAIGRDKILIDRRVTVSGGVASCPADATDPRGARAPRGRRALLGQAQRQEPLRRLERGQRRFAGGRGRVEARAPARRRHDDRRPAPSHARPLRERRGVRGGAGPRARPGWRPHRPPAPGRALPRHRQGGRQLSDPEQALAAEPIRDGGDEAAPGCRRDDADARRPARRGTLDPRAPRVRRRSGYPHGLRGDEIPFEARIIFVADAFEAMTSDRPYRDGISVEAALDELRACVGTQFDPDVVEALAELVERSELPELALKNASAEPR